MGGCLGLKQKEVEEKKKESQKRSHNRIFKTFPLLMRHLTYTSKKPQLGNTMAAQFSAEQTPKKNYFIAQLQGSFFSSKASRNCSADDDMDPPRDRSIWGVGRVP